MSLPEYDPTIDSYGFDEPTQNLVGSYEIDVRRTTTTPLSVTNYHSPTYLEAQLACDFLAEARAKFEEQSTDGSIIKDGNTQS